MRIVQHLIENTKARTNVSFSIRARTQIEVNYRGLKRSSDSRLRQSKEVSLQISECLAQFKRNQNSNTSRQGNSARARSRKLP